MDFLSHLTGSTTQGSKPSIFELIAQDKMRDLLQPAFLYMFSLYAQRYPSYLLRWYSHANKIYAIILILIEYSYLSEWSKFKLVFGLNIGRIISDRIFLWVKTIFHAIESSSNDSIINKFGNGMHV